jgi:hypothetical protein
MSKPQRRRSSAKITLVLIGAASVTGCSDPPPPPPLQRDVYQHRSQCVQDWGDEKKCEVISSGSHRGYFYGPGYSMGSDGRMSPQRPGSSVGGVSGGDRASGVSSRATTTHTVARSGFGSSSSAHSSGS